MSEGFNAHHERHEASGDDAMRLDDLETPEDNTDLNASAAAHGLCPKFSGSAVEALLGDGSWGGVPAASHAATHAYDGTDPITFADTTYTVVRMSGNPSAPSEGQAVVWLSDGVGHGDAGDLMIAVTQGGVTRWGTLFDHSGGSAW